MSSLSSFDIVSLAFWSPGPAEMMVLAVVALLLYGGNLPEVARSWGKSFAEFRRGLSGIQNELNDVIYSKPDYSSPEQLPYHDDKYGDDKYGDDEYGEEKYRDDAVVDQGYADSCDEGADDEGESDAQLTSSAETNGDLQKLSDEEAAAKRAAGEAVVDHSTDAGSAPTDSYSAATEEKLNEDERLDS